MAAVVAVITIGIMLYASCREAYPLMPGQDLEDDPCLMFLYVALRIAHAITEAARELDN